MSAWPRLPRLNPCVPCLVAPNPLTPAERKRLNREIKQLEGLSTSGDCMTRGFVGGLKTCEARHNPGKTLPNPRPGPWVVWHKEKCARVRRGSDQARQLRAAGYNRVARFASHDEADRVADEQFGGRLNPKLMVLNPSSDPLLAKVERRIGRGLTGEELALFERAKRELKTFHGRGCDVLVPVQVPKGTPLFVNYVGDADRVDYTVHAKSSARRGKWTHEAGDHGRKRRTPPPALVSLPGQKTPPIFAQKDGSEMFFKPTHGIMG